MSGTLVPILASRSKNIKRIVRVEEKFCIHICVDLNLVLHGQAVFRACEQLKQEGWEPDWIINHVGFGNGLYLSDAFQMHVELDCSSGTTIPEAPMLTSSAWTSRT